MVFNMDKPTHYCIRVKGHLDTVWSDWFDELEVAHEDNGETTLSGTIRDQAALQGVLLKVSNLGLSLISVNPIEPEQTSTEKPEEPRPSGE